MTGLRSMTGFGRGSVTVEGVSLEVELRSVNHRFFDARLRLPAALSAHGPALETAVRDRLQRGRVDIVARLERVDSAPVTLDREKAISAFRQLESLRDELVPRRPVPLEMLRAVPDLFVSRAAPAAMDDASVLNAVNDALENLDTMRASEGARLGVDLRKRVDTVRSLVNEVKTRTDGAGSSIRAQLKERITALLNDVPQGTLDSGRLEMEVALLSDRTDVAEELVRLSSHLDQLERFLDEGGPVGRRIDFLLQEVNREINTVGSKSADAGVAHLVVETKTEVERIREQVQNLV